MRFPSNYYTTLRLLEARASAVDESHNIIRKAHETIREARELIARADELLAKR